MSNGFDAASDARFRATVEGEQRHIWRQIELLWQCNARRRSEVEALTSRINAAILAAAGLLAAALMAYIKPHLGL